MTRTRIVFAVAGVIAMLWGVSSIAGVHYTNPTMQVEVTGFDGSYPVAVSTSAPSTSCQSSIVTCGYANGDAGQVALPSSALAGRVYLEVQNLGTSSVYIDEGADAGFGRRLFAGEERRWDCAPTACPLRCYGNGIPVYVRECK